MNSPIIISCGDPAGCGPLITLKAVKDLRNKKADIFLSADETVLKNISLYKRLKKRITLIDAKTPGIVKLKKGQASKLSGKASLAYLKNALQTAENNGIKRLITAPLSKEAVGLTVNHFQGHTEYLANHFKINNFAMMMVHPKLKAVLLTRHISLADVPKALTKKLVQDTLGLVHSSLKSNFSLSNPKIALVSLNPHAGVNTHLEKEEKTLLRAAAGFKGRIYGPFPADTVFIPQILKNFDCLICPYHDQAMIPFKLLAFKQGVNVTLGLPIVRTSPAHGTAFQLIKKGKTPMHSSMLAAIRLAFKLKTAA